jgi:hypothetical protein
MKFIQVLEASRFSGDTAAVSLEIFVPETAESAFSIVEQ